MRNADESFERDSLESILARAIPCPATGCFLWEGGVNHKGYGILGFRGRTSRAHRAVWIVSHGDIPRGLFVCHRCDVRACINPDHLFLATHKENMADMANKGRAFKPLGELASNSRLRPDQVIAIRSDRRLQREIAASYGVSLGCIRAIYARKSWSHI